MAIYKQLEVITRPKQDLFPMKRILSESKAGVWGNAFTTTITQQQKLRLFAVSDCLYFYEPYHEKVDNYCCDSKV